MPPPIQMPKREPARSHTIDRYGELCRQIDEFAPVLAEHKILKEEIDGWITDRPAEEVDTIDGDTYSLQYFAKERERTITNPVKLFGRLKKQLGLNTTIGLITIPLGAAVDKFIPKEDHALFLVEARTGSRKLKAVPKSSPTAPQKKAA